MKAKSIKGKTPEDIKLALQQCTTEGSAVDSQIFKPTLAIVFLSIKVDREAISVILDTEGISIFGVTTGGEFIDGEIESESIAILLMEMDPSHFRIYLEELQDTDTRAIAKQMGDVAVEQFSVPAFLVCNSGVFVDCEMLIRGIEDAAGKDTIIYGGVAGDDFLFKETYVFTNDKSSKQAILMLCLDTDKIDLKGRAICGWKTAGTQKTITQSEGMWIHTIDDQPALDLIVKYMGLKTERKQDIDQVVFEVGVHYPLLLIRKGDDPIVRPIMLFNWEDKSVMVKGSVEQGDKIYLSLPPDFEVMDEVIERSKEVKENELQDADALIMFSCAGRLTALGPLIGKEIDGVLNLYDAPMVGLFSYGEFGRAARGNHEFHNLTCCWVALKEK